jgi:hypothetical protein
VVVFAIGRLALLKREPWSAFVTATPFFSSSSPYDKYTDGDTANCEDDHASPSRYRRM